jgi:exocyst complex component 5
VRKDVQTKTEQMEKSVRVAEREYSKKMTELNRGFDVQVTCPTYPPATNVLIQAVGNSFSGMESRMNEVSSTAIRIGEQTLLYPVQLGL